MISLPFCSIQTNKMKRVEKVVVQRKKPVKRSNKKFLKRLVDYLKTDTYLFAPLTSPSSKSSLKGVEQREHTGKNSKGLLKKIEEFLSSDSYMYAPCINPQTSTSAAKGSVQLVKRVTFAVSTSTSAANDKYMFGGPGKEGTEMISSSDQQTLVHKESVKHMIYQKFRSSLLPEEEKLDSKIRKIALY